MAAQLPPIGLDLVARGAQTFAAHMKQVNDSASQTVKNLENAAKAGKKFDQGNLDQAKSVALLSGKMLALAAVIGTVVAALGGLVALAVRGAGLRGIADSFNLITASAGIAAKTLLVNMRQAAQGTVADLELLRLTNLALAGATNQVATAIGEGLPDLLKIARAQARATGQDVDFLFQSLITGIKRSAPMLIDNTGLVLKLGEANQRYAESVGKTVDQLSAADKQIAILNATLEAGQRAIQIASQIQETAAEKISRANATITNTLDTLAMALQPAFEPFLDWINAILGGIEELVRAAAPWIAALATLLGRAFAGAAEDVNESIDAINFDRQIRRFVRGGVAMIGGLAAGMAQGAIQVVTVVRQLAETIYDFLAGLSPPKKGPLHYIDQGGEKVMEAWLGGFTGASLDPVKKVAQEVFNLLGPIAKMGLKQVEHRLAQLDAAVKPFEDRLKIIRAHLDALKEAAEPALDAINRQQEGLMQALVSGDQQAAERIRMLDRQREIIENTLADQQEQVDLAAVQLGLAKSLQARERAMLEVRKSQIPVFDAIEKAKEKAGESAKVPKGVGGAPQLPEAPGGEGGIGTIGAGQDVLGAMGLDPDSIQEAMTTIENAWEESGAAGALHTLSLEGRLLQNTMNRIGTVDVGAKIGEKFQRLVSNVETGLNDAKTSIQTWITDRQTDFANWADGVVNPERELSVPWFFNTLPQRLTDAFAPISGTISGWIRDIADPSVEGSIPHWFDGIVNPMREGSIPYALSQLYTLASGALDSLKDQFLDWVDSITNPAREGSLPFIFAQLPGNIGTALRSIGLIIWNTLATPIINVLNWLIDRFNDFLSTIGGVAEQLQETLASIGVQFDAFQIGSLPHISTTPPGFLTGAARGGLFGLRVGERGAENVMSAQQLAVFPNAFVRAVDRLTMAMVTRPTPMPVASASSVYNNQMTNNFYGVDGSGDVMRRMAMVNARR